MTAPRLPWWLRLMERLVVWTGPASSADAEELDAALGDLAEEWAERGETWWYVRHALSCVPLALRLRFCSGEQTLSRSGKDGVMSNLLQDVRYGLRAMAKSPGFAAVVIVTLGLGIAANTIVFSVVDGVVLNPFPYPDGDRLVGVGTEFPRLNGELNFVEHMSPAEYADIRDQSRTLEHVVAWDMGNRTVTFGETTENLFSAFWFGDAFPTLGMPAFLGRGFTEEELAEGAPVAILSHRVWQNRFGADRSLVGGRILMNGEPYTVVGIMPPGALLYGTDLWLPMGTTPEVIPRNRRQFQVLARLAPDASLTEANAELAGLAGRIATAYGQEFAEYEGWRLEAATWRDINVNQLEPAALILTGAVGFVLLLVAANIASLKLARGAARQREIAVRAALGAGRGRILSQLLTESVLLALAGGALGVLVGWAGVRAVSGVIYSLGLPLPGDVALNSRVLLISAVVAVGTGLAFGVVPALHASRFQLQRTLQAESQAVAGASARLRLQRIMVGVEVALALALMAGSGLLVNSFVRLRTVDPGFDASNVLTMRLTLAWNRYEPARMEAFFATLRERVEAIPGVESVATGSQYPPRAFGRAQFAIEGRVPDAAGSVNTAYATLVSPDYFDVLRVPVLRGRALATTDREGAPFVAVVNEAAMRQFFPDIDPIGQRLRVGDDSPWMEIVGVVGSARNQGIDLEPAPELYASTLQTSGWNNQMYLMIRTQGEPRPILPAVREAVRSIDPEQPVYQIRTLEEAVSATQTTRRVSTVSLGIFGVFSLLLAALGIYAVVAYAVSQRRRELGLRIALGAGQGQVRRLVLKQAMIPVAIGSIIGLAAAFAMGSVMSSLLFGITGSDPLTLVGTTLLLGGTALFASWLPARRASRMDPCRALRLD
jgi:putative ABC transport system permease protein